MKPLLKGLLTEMFSELLVKRYLCKTSEVKNYIETLAETIVGNGPGKEMSIHTLKKYLFGKEND